MPNEATKNDPTTCAHHLGWLRSETEGGRGAQPIPRLSCVGCSRTWPLGGGLDAVLAAAKRNADESMRQRSDLERRLKALEQRVDALTAK